MSTVQAYAYFYECIQCKTLERWVEPVTPNSAWRAEEYEAPPSQGGYLLGFLVSDDNNNRILVRMKTGILAIFECRSDGTVTENLSAALRKKVKDQHIPESDECVAKTKEAVEEKFQGPKKK